MTALKKPDPLNTKPFEKRRQYSVWFRPSIYKAIQHEAIDRGLSIGEILEEAMQLRPTQEESK